MARNPKESDSHHEDAKLLPRPAFQDSRSEAIVDLVGLAIGAGVPVLGPILQGLLSGGLTARRFERVQDAVKEIVDELEAHREKLNQDYVKSEEFEELLAQTLDKISRELDDEKRSVYKNFLLRIMTSPAQSYWAQRHLLRLAEELSPSHIRLLRAFLVQPAGSPIMGARIRMLATRIGATVDEATEWARDLERSGLARDVNALMGMVTNSEETSPFISSLGSQLVRFIAQ